MDNAEVIKKLKQYKKLLSKHMTFEDLILYGSYAKGNAREDSDVDVAIVVNTLSGDYFSTRPLLWKIRREVDDRIEPVLIEKDLVNERLDHENLASAEQGHHHHADHGYDKLWNERPDQRQDFFVNISFAHGLFICFVAE